MNLEAMTLPQLVELHNRHADRPVRKFRDRATAIRRVRAVLPNAKGGGGRRAAHLDLVEGLLRGGATLATLMEATGAPDRKVRAYIDQLRDRGYEVVRIGPSQWQLAD